MKITSTTKWIAAAVVAPIALSTTSQAVLVISGITDGDLPGGTPKAIILTAGAPIADMTQWGLGVANNGGGSDGQEYTFPAGTAAAGDVFVIAHDSVSNAFFADNFVQNFTLIQNGIATTNGDDPFEVFGGGVVVDTWGDVALDGSGTPWETLDGYAVRTGGGPGAFDEANYSINNGGFDGLDEAQHVAIFAANGFTPIPEPSSSVFLALGCMALLRRRR